MLRIFILDFLFKFLPFLLFVLFSWGIFKTSKKRNWYFGSFIVCNLGILTYYFGVIVIRRWEGMGYGFLGFIILCVGLILLLSTWISDKTTKNKGANMGPKVSGE